MEIWKKWFQVFSMEKGTLIICPGSPSSRLFTCFVFKFISLTITVLLCLKTLVISPILPFSWPAISFTVSPTLTCILCNTGRLFGLQSFRSQRLSCQRKNKVKPQENVWTVPISYIRQLDIIIKLILWLYPLS